MTSWLFALLLRLWLGSAQAAVVDRVAAVVNDDVITLSEIYDLGGDFISQRVTDANNGPGARRSAELEVLDSIVTRRLISQEISKLSLEVSDEELDATVDDIAKKNGLNRDSLRAEVEKGGMSWTQYRSELKENLRQRKFTQTVILPRISVNEDELKDAYRRLVASAGLPQVTDLGAMMIQVPADEEGKAAAMAKAEAAVAEVRGGKPFADVAAAQDQGPYGANGGHMGSFRQGELVSTLNDPAFALPVGGVSDPILMPQGIFILYVFDRKTADAQPFEAARDQLFEQVYSARIDDEMAQWAQQARRKAAVSVKLLPVEGGQGPLLP